MGVRDLLGRGVAGEGGCHGRNKLGRDCHSVNRPGSWRTGGEVVRCDCSGRPSLPCVCVFEMWHWFNVPVDGVRLVWVYGVSCTYAGCVDDAWEGC